MHRSLVRHDEDGEGGTYIRRQVFPQAPSPTMTSLRRISAMLYRCTRQHASGLGWIRKAANVVVYNCIVRRRECERVEKVRGIVFVMVEVVG